MTLRIISPRGAMADIPAEKIFFPGVEGSFEILGNHAAIIAALRGGDIRYEGPENGSIAISSGFVRVKDNIVEAIVEL